MTAPIDRAAEALWDSAGCPEDEHPDNWLPDARDALSAALTDPDVERGPNEDLAPGSLARAIWETELTDGTRGVTVRDARALAAAVRAAILGDAS